LLKIVIDTNVIISALRSRKGASYRLLMLLGDDRLKSVISVPLFLEYESVAKRLTDSQGLSIGVIDDVLDYLCQVSTFRREIYYLWRPFLKDPGDDMVLEVAVAAECPYIITFNQADFDGSETFGVQAIKPTAFLELIGDL
jgi:putative PIN family toxin of toxin-antitoxin system